jgi:hypothetical protein
MLPTKNKLFQVQLVRVQFSINREGIWNIQKVLLDHNHQLISPDNMQMSQAGE